MLSSNLLVLIVASTTLAQSPFPPFSGDPFQKYNLSAPGIKASFIPYGARLTNLYVPDKSKTLRDVALGYDAGVQYLNDTETVHTYFGAVVGRYANRIRNGTFTVDGVESHIPENEHGGLNTLHGGKVGYDQRNWTVVAQSSSSITFMLYDNAFEGFPGDVINHATYTLDTSPDGNPRWTSRMVSMPLNAPTPIMLANHVYWNLGAFINTGAQTVLSTSLHMPYADRYILFDGLEVPTGQLGYTPNTPYDFTKDKRIGTDIAKTINGCGTNCTGYDNAFIMDRPRYSAPEATDLTLLTMRSPDTGIQMDLTTNQQSLQIYTCDTLNGTIPRKTNQQDSSGGSYEKYGCIVIETQQWIDGINHPEWGQLEYQIYRPNEEPAVNFAQYEFSVVP